MRLNQFIATTSGLSRRAADTAIQEGRVHVDGQVATLGQPHHEATTVTLDGHQLTLGSFRYILFNKPTGYVCSRTQQGNTPTIYALLPPSEHDLKSIGRLDRDSSGLLVLTNDGVLANKLAHPSSEKVKTYEVRLDKTAPTTIAEKLEAGVALNDGPSQLKVTSHAGRNLTVTLHEGRNRQIRRTFEALGYTVVKLHRTSLGGLTLGNLPVGQWRPITREELI